MRANSHFSQALLKSLSKMFFRNEIFRGPQQHLHFENLKLSRYI